MELKELQSEAMSEVVQECLTPKHAADPTVLLFIGNYLACREVGQAAKASDITLNDGKWMLRQPDIYKCILKLTEMAVEKFGFSAAEVVERVKEIAFLDPAELENENGTYKKSLRDIPPHLRRGLKKLKVKNIFEEDHNGIPQFKGEIIEYEFWDKLRANELLSRDKDVFKKTTVVQHEVGKNARSLLLDSNKRAADRQLSMGNVIDVTPKEVPEDIPPPPPLPRMG
jgi:hypothetical protein